MFRGGVGDYEGFDLIHELINWWIHNLDYWEVIETLGSRAYLEKVTGAFSLFHSFFSLAVLTLHDLKEERFNLSYGFRGFTL